MLVRLHRWLKEKRRSTILAICLLLVAIVGVLDYVTGFEISFSIFYLIPIFTAAWYTRKVSGVAVAACSACTWLLVESVSRPIGNSPSILLWNASVRLGFFLVITHLLGEVKLRLDQESKLARVDHVTGVMNSLGFEEESDRLLRLARRHGHPMSLAYLDLDNFKRVNDTFGHREGSRVLRVFGQALQQLLRGSDLVARLGGDEFAVFFPETDAEGTRAVIAKLREQLPYLVSKSSLQVTYSIGVVTCEGRHPRLDDLIRKADELMYRVKQSGKNNVCYDVWASMATPPS